MRGVFVTGTDTDVGKTVLSALLMAAAPYDVRYWKPVQTGVGAADVTPDDTATVAALAGLPPTRLHLAGARHALPASPHHAAAAEGAEITLAGLLDVAPTAGRWVVEGAGGLLVPLSGSALISDLALALGLPVVVAASTRLGCINHTLLTVRQAVAIGLQVRGVVLLGARDPSALSGLAAHCPVPVLAEIPWLDPLNPATVLAASGALASVWAD